MPAIAVSQALLVPSDGKEFSGNGTTGPGNIAMSDVTLHSRPSTFVEDDACALSLSLCGMLFIFFVLLGAGGKIRDGYL